MVFGLLAGAIVAAGAVYYIYRQITEPGPNVFPANMREQEQQWKITLKASDVGEIENSEENA